MDKILRFFAHRGLLTLLLVWTGTGVWAQASLQPGDVAIIAYNADDPDGFAWVALVSIPANTTINFTDSGWESTAFRPSEHFNASGPLKWSHTSAVAAGTVISWNGTTWSLGTFAGSTIAFATAGDQLFAYTGTNAAPAFLYGINFANAGWIVGSTSNSANTSNIPAALSVVSNTAFDAGNFENGYYSGVTVGSKTQILAAIANTANWTRNNTGPLNTSLWPTSFSVISLEASPTSLSLGSTVQGTTSTPQTYSISASSLTATIDITAPTGVEVSTAVQGTYSPSLTLPISTTAGIIYARLTGASAGTFSGSITNVSGLLTATVAISGTVTSLTSPTITNSIAQLTACVGSPLTLSATCAAGSVVWNNNTTASTFTLASVPAGPTSYSAACLSGTQSSTVATATVIGSAPSLVLTPTPNATVTCGTAVTLITSGNFTGIVWNDNSTNSSLPVMAEGIYAVTVTAANGCTSSTTAAISSNTESPSLNSFVASGTLTCSQRSVTLTATASGGVSPLSYSIAGPGLSSPLTSSVVSVSVGGSYTLTVAGANGCSSTTTVMVQTNTTPPPASLSASGLLSCGAASVSLVAGGGVSYTFVSSTGVMGSTGNVAVVSNIGTYTVLVTGSNGCTLSAQTSVLSSGTKVPLSLTSSSPALGCGESSVEIRATTSGATGYSLVGAGQSLINQTGVFSVSAAGVYSVSASLGAGCIGVGSQTVGAAITPSASNIVFSPVLGTICMGKLSATVTGASFVFTGPNGYVFSNVYRNPGTYQIFALEVKETGTYTLTVSGGAGCSTATYTITITDTCR